MDITTYQNQGKRDYQEDRYVVLQRFCGYSHLTLCFVCDGHGGDSVSTFLQNQYPIQLQKVFEVEKTKPVVSSSSTSRSKEDNNNKRKTFGEMLGTALELCIEIWDKKCFGTSYNKIHNDAAKSKFFSNRDNEYWEKHGLEAGSTFVCMLIDAKKQKAHTVTLGDSRATWIIDNSAISQTVDHKVKRKMTPVKGFKCTNSDGRLQGDLAMQGAVGDNTESLYGLVSRAYHTGIIDLRGKQNFRAVIASDGLYDVLEPQAILYESFKNATELANFALESIKTKESENRIRFLAEQCEREGVDLDQYMIDNPMNIVIPEFDDNVSIIYVRIDDLPKCFRAFPSRGRPRKNTTANDGGVGDKSIISKTKNQNSLLLLKDNEVEEEDEINETDDEQQQEIRFHEAAAAASKRSQIQQPHVVQGYEIKEEGQDEEYSNENKVDPTVEVRKKLEKVQLLINDLTKDVAITASVAVPKPFVAPATSSKIKVPPGNVNFSQVSPQPYTSCSSVLTNGNANDVLQTLAKKKASIERRKNLLQNNNSKTSSSVPTTTNSGSTQRKASLKQQQQQLQQQQSTTKKPSKKNETFHSFKDGNLTMNFLRKNSLKR